MAELPDPWFDNLRQHIINKQWKRARGCVQHITQGVTSGDIPTLAPMPGKVALRLLRLSLQKRTGEQDG